MRLTRSQWCILVLAILTVAVGIATNIATAQMPERLKPYLWIAWPVLGLLAAVFIILTVWQARIDARPASTLQQPLRVELVRPPRPKEQPKPPIPQPPTPYLAHPYPMQEHFTGRVRERQMLTEWLTKDDRPVLSIVALGGMGKSALAWAWLLRDVLGLPLPGLPADACDAACRVPEAGRPEGVLWWSFYERESTFGKFVEEALVYCSSGTVNLEAVPSAYDRVRGLVGLLQQRRILLILDGFERQLRAYSGLGAAYQGDDDQAQPGQDPRACVDPHAAEFLRWAAAGPLAGRVLLTTRLHPVELEGCAGGRREDLPAMDPEDAVAFFHAQGVTGTRAEIQAECEPYGYHPLALRLLAGLIARDQRRPGDIQVAKRYPVLPDLKGKERHHILTVAYDTLDETRQTLLSRMAAFRSPMAYDAAAIFNPYKTPEKFDAALEELTARGLLLWDRDHGRYDLHPIVRQYAYDRLGDKEDAHTRLRDYFAAVPQPDTQKVESLEDLVPTIELYHHTVRARRYDEAQDLFRDRLAEPLYFRFGAYQTRIDLLRALFPDGEDKPPRLKSEADQAWVLNALAISYSLSGQPRRAVPLFERQIAIREKQGIKVSVAIGQGNLANRWMELGELAAAEKNLRRSIELCREIEDEFKEAIGHQELGRLLAYRGAFDEATREAADSAGYGERTQDKQGTCIDEAYRALRALLMGDAKAALEAARQARELADETARTRFPHERDFVRAEWLIGWALVAIAAEDKAGRDSLLAEADKHLTEALTRCRRINLVESEPDILLAWALWHRVKGNAGQARETVEEALMIADRCEYRLVQADCHNFLARLDVDAGDKAAAAQHARAAHERALCDGPPHCYKPALDEAKRLMDG